MNFGQHADANQEQYTTEHLESVRIPSISALPNHAGDVRQAAAWVAARLQQAAFENIWVMETGGHPVVQWGLAISQRSAYSSHLRTI